MTFTAYRNSVGLSQAECARQLGVGRSYVCSLEGGYLTPSVNMALKIDAWSGGAVTAASLSPVVRQIAEAQAAA